MEGKSNDPEMVDLYAKIREKTISVLGDHLELLENIDLDVLTLCEIYKSLYENYGTKILVCEQRPFVEPHLPECLSALEGSRTNLQCLLSLLRLINQIVFCPIILKMVLIF